jgi:hypothetical protein
LNFQEVENYSIALGFQRVQNLAGVSGSNYTLFTAYNPSNGRVIHAHAWTERTRDVKVTLEQINSESENIEGFAARKTVERLIVGVADLTSLQNLVPRLLR